jgi:Cys-tRNA(Pro) deacylase
LLSAQATAKADLKIGILDLGKYVLSRKACPRTSLLKEAVMSRATRATKMLEQAGIAFTIHSYDYDPDSDRIGIQAAEALGEPPEQVLKTLMALVDGKPVCVIVPSDREVSMKKLAAAFGGKSAAMMKAADAERLSGYKVGGISRELRRDRLAGGVTPSSATVATDRDSGAVVPSYLCAYEFQKQPRMKRRRFRLARDRIERIQVAALHRRTRDDLDHHACHAGIGRRARADR